MTIICRTYKQLHEALDRQGFFLTSTFPRMIDVQIRRGMLIVRIP